MNIKSIYLVTCGIEDFAFTNERDAREKYNHLVKKSWERCIKFSCPKGEFYDDYGRTLDKAILEHYTRIAGKEIMMKMILLYGEEED